MHTAASFTEGMIVVSPVVFIPQPVVFTNFLSLQDVCVVYPSSVLEIFVNVYISEQHEAFAYPSQLK
jgi:hypothetical protein